MEPSSRIGLIVQIAEALSDTDYSILDLTLRQFGLPWSDIWSGSKFDYVVRMVEEASEETLIQLAKHTGVVSKEGHRPSTVSSTLARQLIAGIEAQKAVMISVATGGDRIQQVNDKYKAQRSVLIDQFEQLDMIDPNPFVGLWAWYGKWSDGSLPSYQSRRTYIAELYQSSINELSKMARGKVSPDIQPTGWGRVDRSMEKCIGAFSNARNEEDFQAIGLLCREVLISLAQAVYDPNLHPPIDEVLPSQTDAKRMLESYITAIVGGETNEDVRKYAKAVYQLAVMLQHRRNATFREAAHCIEATRSLVNTISILAGVRDSF